MSLVHGFTHDKSVSCLFKSVSAAGLAQSVEPLTAEREVEGFDSRGRTNTQGLKKNGQCKTKTADCRLQTADQGHQLNLQF